MPTLKFPLVGSYTTRKVDSNLSDTTDQRFINFFPETRVNPITGATSVVLSKRQGGSVPNADVSSGATGDYGACVWMASSSFPTVMSYTKSSGTDCAFYQGETGTQVGGDVAGTKDCQYLTDTLISTTANLTATLKDSTTSAIELWFYPDGGAWTQVTDAQFPTSGVCPGHVHIDGYCLVMTSNGRVYHSDLNSLSSWDGSYITANSVTDGGVGLAKYGKLVAAMGINSIEFFYNAGNPTGSPLKRADVPVVHIGVLDNRSNGVPFRQVGETIYWIGRDSVNGGCGVYRLNGFKPEKISPVSVDRMIATGVLDFIGGAFLLNGMTHIAVCRSAGGTLAMCYCIEHKFWWQLSFAVVPTAIIGGIGTTEVGVTFLASVSNAKIYQFSSAAPVWQDNSAAYTATVQTDNMDVGTDRMKTWDQIRLTYDRQSAASNIGVSWSDDDFANYSTAINIDTNTDQSWLTALGASARRSWKLTHAANTACRIHRAEIDYTLGR